MDEGVRYACESDSSETKSAASSEKCFTLCCSNYTPVEYSSLLILPTEILVTVFSFLSAYDKLSVRITCQRLYSIVSDPHVWSGVVWRDRPRSDRNYKALKLSLKLASRSVQSIFISVRSSTPNGRLPISKFLPQILQCECVRFLNLTGMELSMPVLNGLVSSLPSLYCLTVDTGRKTLSHEVVKVAAKSNSLHILTVSSIKDRVFRTLGTWQESGYSPPDLRVRETFHSSVWFSLPGYFKDMPLCDHPARLAFYPNSSSVVGNTFWKYPLFEMSLFPRVSVLTCLSESLGLTRKTSSFATLSTDSVSSEICISVSFVDLRYNGTINPTFLDYSISFLPASIQSLSMAGFNHLASTHLTAVSNFCPNLIRLNVAGCKEALLTLQGLSDVGLRCSKLSGLCLMGIEQKQVERVTTLWEILARMEKLRHLAVSDSLMNPDRESACLTSSSSLSGKGGRISHVRPVNTDSQRQTRRSVSQMTNLVAFETNRNKIDPSSPRQGNNFNLILSSFSSLRHLRVVHTSIPVVYTLPFTEILSNCQHITYLYISVTRQHINLPSDPNCYHSLRQLYIHCPKFALSKEVAQSLVYHGMLTHVYLHVCTTDTVLKSFIRGLPRLVECHLVIITTGLSINISQKQSYLKSLGVNHSIQEVVNLDSVDECCEGSDLESLWLSGNLI